MNTNLAVYVVSLGCAKNLVDTEVMCGALLTNGFFLAEEENDADIMLINTCGFIRDARDESFEQIDIALEWKGLVDGRMVVVAGCLAQRNADLLMEKFPGIDLLVGLDDIAKLPDMIREVEKTGKSRMPSKELPTYLYDHLSPRLSLTPRTFGYVKIAEGCDHRCAYCAIPLIRGNQRSRTPESIELECRQLLDQGALELNFIAQDTSRYGVELPGGQSLEALLRRCDKIDGDFWIRVLYTHPLHLTEGLMEVLTDSRHVLPYLDIPLQHISTPILSAMKRGLDGPRTKELLRKIRAMRPDMTVRTTFMVGFPGETDADFQELLEFVKEYKFDRLGVFAFSPEEGTPAAAIKDGIVPPEVAEERRKLLLEAQQKISYNNNKQFVGKKVRVLLENPVTKRKWEGRTVGDAPDVDQVVTVTLAKSRTEDQFGFTDVMIRDAGKYGLFGLETV